MEGDRENAYVRNISQENKPPEQLAQVAAPPRSNQLLIFTGVTVLAAVVLAFCLLRGAYVNGQTENLLKEKLKVKDETIEQKIQELETLQLSYAEQNKLLNESQYIAKIYQSQLELLQTIGKAIKNMDICRLFLERYCKLIENSTQLNDDEKEEKKRLQNDLDCKDDVSADYHLKIKESFQEHVKNVLHFRQAQVNLMIKGDFQKMKIEQENSKNIPSETCRFICDLEESDLKSLGEEETVFETGWKIFQTFFYT